MKLFVLAIATFGLGLAGCKGDKKSDRAAKQHEAVERHRDAVTKRLDAILSIAAKPLPPVTGSLTGAVPAALLVLPADPAALARYRKGEWTQDWSSSYGIEAVPKLLAGEPEDPARTEAMLAGFEAHDRVLLVKTLERKLPEATTPEKLVSGHVSADLYLFGFDGTAYGSVHIEAGSSDMVLYDKTKNRGDNSKTMMEKDLDDNAKKALHDALVKSFPSIKGV